MAAVIVAMFTASVAVLSEAGFLELVLNFINDRCVMFHV